MQLRAVPRRARRSERDGWGCWLQACSAPTASQPVTVYLGPVEVRKWKKTTTEEMTLFPTPDVRIVRRVSSGNVPKVGMLHRDGLGTVRAVTSDEGLANETDLYRPFGEQAETVLSEQ